MADSPVVFSRLGTGRPCGLSPLSEVAVGGRSGVPNELLEYGGECCAWFCCMVSTVGKWFALA